MRRAYVKFRTQGLPSGRRPLKRTQGGVGGYFSRRRGRIYGRETAKKTGYWAGVQALNEVRRLKREGEIKEKTANTALTVPLADTWVTQYLNDIDKGTGLNNRIANKIVIKTVQTRTQVQFNAAETGISAIRIAIVYDRNPRGNLAAGANIFTHNSIRGNINSSDPLYAGRFQILYDEMFEFDYDNSAAGSTNWIYPKWFIKRSMKCEYNETGNGIADCQKGALLFCAVSGSATHDTTINHETKIKYSDN